MPPELGPQTGGDYEDGGEQGNFLTRKIGPVPMWGIIAGVGVLAFVLFKKLSGGGSGSQVSTSPSNDSGTMPWGNLDAALAQIQANEQTIQDAIDKGKANNPANSTTSSGTQNNKPPAHQTSKGKSKPAPAHSAPHPPPASKPAPPKPAPPVNQPTPGSIVAALGANAPGFRE